ncbi:hypothetical protein NL676_033169 [Syzygium grande]|nr:hypothetical protein NL676_033169 [Syzygium grande]
MQSAFRTTSTIWLTIRIAAARPPRAPSPSAAGLRSLKRRTSRRRRRRRRQIMNRGGGAGAGLGSGSGPTAAAAAAAVQKQRALLQRVETDIGHIVDNFSQLVKVARVNDPPVRNSQEAFMMEMRAARMVQAADSLLKLVSELKQTAIFSDSHL